MKKALFHVLFGDYDDFQEPAYIQPDIDYYLFTDQSIVSDLYTVVNIQPGIRSTLTARQWKIVKGYQYLCEQGYDVVIYTDCTIRPVANIDPLLDLQICDLMILKHPVRDCIYDEYYACTNPPRDNAEVMHKQVQGYADMGYPKHNGMVSSGLNFRRNSKDVLKFCKAWLREVERGSIRDQLSFNYVAWQRQYKFDLLDWNYLFDYFTYNAKHKWKTY